MYSKKQAGEVHNRFWEAFGKYMSPVPSASGGRISWTNYNTGLRALHFKMHVTGAEAYIGIEMDISELGGIHVEYFNRFHVLKDALEATIGEKWHWEQESRNMNGEAVGRIFMRMDNVNIYDERDWPRIISFLKPRIIALDRFWFENFEFFEIVG